MNIENKRFINMDELMMQALDGTISKADRARLTAYLMANPDERALFESMLQTEALLRNLPMAKPSNNFASNVMVAVGHAHIAAKPSPAVNGNQMLLLFLTCTISAVMMIIISAAVISMLSTYAGPQLHATVGVLRSIGTMGRESFGVIAAFARFVMTQPLVWIASIAGGLVVAIWLRVLAGLWLPTQPKTQLA